MFSRLFTPVAFSRLFDPMPLPRRVRQAYNTLRSGHNNSPQIRTYSFHPVKVKVNKVPLYR